MISYPITRDMNQPPHIIFGADAGTDESTSPLRLDLMPWYTSGFE